jgi:ArsR family transcriptional regulator, arsenate/arsenite/antimonite-responsive transcriptional repressor
MGAAIMREFLAITGALSDENRVRTLLALRGGELCVCQITELLGLAPSTVSKHISLLRAAGLVEVRKEGRWIFYRLADEQAVPMAREAIEWAMLSLAESPRVREDIKRLKRILKEDPEEICRRQMGKSPSCSSAPAIPAGARWPRDGRESSRAT